MRGAAAAVVSEARALGALRAWRRGVGALEPWFRATPFAAAHHYRARRLPGRPGTAMPGPVERLLRSLPRPGRHTLWIFDLPGPSALWLAYGLRRRLGMAAALAWNGWYDPRGALDGCEEIPLLLALGARLDRLRSPRRACLVFDSRRGTAKAGDALDNRYVLGEEDAPSLEHLDALGIRRVRVWVWEAVAEDLSAYLAYLRTRVPVRVTDEVGHRA
jgi:hypothetical protein